MGKKIEEVTTEKVFSPRGQCYDWCALMEDGTIEFGDEQGNYCGGTYLSANMYSNLEDYWKDVKRIINHWREKDFLFYQKIINMIIEGVNNYE